mgnify:FL=1
MARGVGLLPLKTYYIMAKLGYTWYPKDWGNSDAVFELTLIERGLYRELIDMAMLNDNTTEINYRLWARKFATTKDELETILITLTDLKLIEIKGNLLFIPSCEARLKLARGGRSGGKKSKPKTSLSKALPKAYSEAYSEALPEALPEAYSEAKEKKVNRKESKDNIYREFLHLKLSMNDFKKLEAEYEKETIDRVLDSIENFAQNKKYKSLYLTAKNWLKKESKRQKKSYVPFTKLFD